MKKNNRAARAARGSGYFHCPGNVGSYNKVFQSNHYHVLWLEKVKMCFSFFHNIKWDHFDILATGNSDLQCKIKETLLIGELKPSLNETVGSEKLFLY